MKEVKKLVLSAVMVALAFVLYEFVSISIPPTTTPFISLSLGIIPIIIIAKYAGVIYSTVSATLVDILGYLLVGASKGYAFHPGYTLNAFISGLVFGLVFYFSDKLNSKLGKTLIIIIESLVTVVTIPIYLYFFNYYNLEAGYSFEYVSYIVSILALVMNILYVLYSIILSNKDSQNALNLGIIVYQIVVSLLLTPLWVSEQVQSKVYIYFWTTRLITVPLTGIIYSIISRLLFVPLSATKLARELEMKSI